MRLVTCDRLIKFCKYSSDGMVSLKPNFEIALLI